MFTKNNKESIDGGKASAKSRFKGKSKKQIHDMMSKLAKKRYKRKLVEDYVEVFSK